MRKYVRADFREDHKAALARGRAKKAERQKDIINQIRQSTDPLTTAFDLLVPSSGKASTEAGELIRAVMRIMYRDLNDGDLFYEGYGIETCGDAVAFLCNKLPYLEEEFERIAMQNMEGQRYTDALNDIAYGVLDHIYDFPNLVIKKNAEDMFDFDGEEFIKDREWEPEYEFECDLPDNVAYHISEGNISKRDAEQEIQTWEGLRDANIRVTDWGILVSGINKDLYDELEYSMSNWLEQWGEDLNNDFGNEEEDYE